MRITALNCAFLCALAIAAEPDTPYMRMSKLAGYLSEGETVGALETFDKNMKDYNAIAGNISAFAAQTEILCSIDVVADKEADDEASDVHHLDLDWYMVLKSRADEGDVERRRQRVAVTMQRFYKKSGKDSVAVWRITSLSPEQILAPITIK